MVNSVVYENVTYKQINDMKHALGFDNRKIRGTKYRRYEPYRNFFLCWATRCRGLGTACIYWFGN